MGPSPAEILRDARTIAVVGASPNPGRPSHGVFAYLLRAGYRCIPVRPLDCDEVLGVPCVASLAEIEEPIDLVDVFRRPEYCADVARQVALAAARDRLARGADRRPGVGHGVRRKPLHRRRARARGAIILAGAIFRPATERS
jgi:hypothetical protein